MTNLDNRTMVLAGNIEGGQNKPCTVCRGGKTSSPGNHIDLPSNDKANPLIEAERRSRGGGDGCKSTIKL